MIYAVLILLGLCFGSFVNAFVWRLHQQESADLSDRKNSRKKSKNGKELSIVRGRSMCPHCKHTLNFLDLIPVFSWLALGGKCRYCKKPIGWQYPIVEVVTAGLFAASYAFWPEVLNRQQSILLGLWLVFVVGFMALTVYDLRWYILPNRIIFPLISVAIMQVLMQTFMFGGGSKTLKTAFFGFIVGGGVFWVLFQVSRGRWIGGGDVKLGALLGLILGGPMQSFLLIFLASVIGTLVVLPPLVAGKVGRQSKLPFGPFLLAAAFILRLSGAAISAWYLRMIGLG